MEKRIWLIEKRKAIGKTQLEVARDIDMSRTYYSEIENGKEPSGKAAHAIARYFGFDMSIFFERNDAFRVVDSSRSEQAATSA